jgi:hypothetical protein
MIAKSSRSREQIVILIEECGILAQLGEHLPYKQGVTGSSPVGPIRSQNPYMAE